MKISVVIPTYNEEKCIKECIESIFANTEPPYEVIVADGGSTDRTVEIARAAGAVVYDNPRRTAASGRNVGISHATGEIIAFTDGDNVADGKWLESIRLAFEGDEALGGVGGKLVPAPPANDVERFWGNLWLTVLMVFGDEEFVVENRDLRNSFVTANCAYKKSLLDDLGGFDEWFGNNAEDVDLMWRAFNLGAKLKYVPTAVVSAHSPTTMKGIRQKSYRNGVSSTKLQKKYGPKKGSFDGRVHKLFWRNFGRMLLFKKGSYMMTTELFYHIMGKWISSVKYGYRNL